MKTITLILALFIGALPLRASEPRGTAVSGRDSDGAYHFLRVTSNGSLVIADAELTIDPTNLATSAKQDTIIARLPVPQLTGTPSNYTIGTSDATVFTLAAGEVGFIQNLDDAALAVKKGASASTTSFSFILAAGQAATDGTGGAVVIKDWVGAVSVAAMTGTARYIAWKQAP